MSRSLRAPAGAPRASRALLLAIAASAGTGLLVTACSAASSGTSSAPRSEHAPGTGYAPAMAGKAAGAPSSQPGTTGLTSLVPSQSIIYTANLTVRVRDVSAAANGAAGIVTAAGGYVAGERKTVPPGRHATARVSLTLKIPVAAYQQALAKLTALGKQLTFSERATDVTQQVADVGSRVASAQAAIRQLRALLSHAGTVSGLLAVQDEINSQESELEALLAQQRALARSTSYATVSVIVVGQRARIVHHPKKAAHGFLAGLAAGWRALVAAVTWLLTAFGAVLPFALVVALLGGLGYAGRRRLAHRRAVTAAGPPAESS